MKQKEINSLNMIDATLTYMDKYKPAWQNEAPIVESIDYITERREKIKKQNDEITESNTTGITAELYAGLDKAVDIAYIIAKRVAVFARKKGNLVLLKEVDHSETDLKDGRFSAIIARLELIAKRAQENLAGLASYKVKQADIDALLAAVNGIKKKPSDRKSTTGQRVESTATAKLLLREILLKLKNEMDDEVEALIENEEIVNGYFAVRRTDDRRGRGPAKKEEVKG